MQVLTCIMDTQEKILAAAFRLFSDRGYDSTSTRLIAEEAGVNEVTLFRHFGSKRELFDDVIRSQAEQREDLIDEVIEPTGDLKEDLVRFGIDINDILRHSSDLYKLLLFEVDRDPKIFEMISHVPIKFIEKFSSYVVYAKDEGLIKEEVDAEVFTMAFFSFFFRAMIEKAFLGEGTIFKVGEEEIQGYVDILVEGVEND